MCWYWGELDLKCCQTHQYYSMFSYKTSCVVLTKLVSPLAKHGHRLRPLHLQSRCRSRESPKPNSDFFIKRIYSFNCRTLEFVKINHGPLLKQYFFLKKATKSSSEVSSEYILFTALSCLLWPQKERHQLCKRSQIHFQVRNDCQSVHVLAGGWWGGASCRLHRTIISVLGSSELFGLSLNPRSSEKQPGNFCLHFSGPSFPPLYRYPGDL